MKIASFVSLRRTNHFLTVVVIGLALYIVALPLMPAASWWIKHEAPVVSKPPSVAVTAQIPDQNVLEISSIGLRETVFSGPTSTTLNKGVWHRPNSNSPDKGGNTVLAGHRFTYSDPAVFYHLDKVAEGAEVTLYWQQKKYNYRVDRIVTVPPTATEIEAPTDKPTLTIYTCTPLWSSKYRLALIASLQEQS